MGYGSPWGRKRVGYNLVTKQCPVSALNVSPSHPQGSLSSIDVSSLFGSVPNNCSLAWPVHPPGPQKAPRTPSAV